MKAVRTSQQTLHKPSASLGFTMNFIALENFGGEVHKLGSLFGSAAVWVEQYLFGGRLPIKISDPTPDHATLKPANRVRKIRYGQA